VHQSDLRTIRIWREHDIPLDRSTVDYANDLIQRMAAEIDELHEVINEMAVRINENSGAADDGPAATNPLTPRQGGVMCRKRNAISRAIAEAVSDLHRTIERASDKERLALRTHNDPLTKTSCCWAEYEAAPIDRSALDRFEDRKNYSGA